MYKTIEGLDNLALVSVDEYERMKNCVNCEHKDVCLAVARRKANKANDYTPCEHWRVKE